MKVNLVSVQYQPNLAVYKEWLAYHHALGFDRIVIFDNNVTLDRIADAEPLPQMFDNVMVIKIKHKVNGSQNFRWDYEHLYLNDCDYFITLDADEYLYFNKNQTVQEFLSNYNKVDWNTLAVPWKDIGSNVPIENGTSVIRDFRMISGKTGIQNLNTGTRSPCNQVKSFIRAGAVNDNVKDSMHYLRDTKDAVLYDGENKNGASWLLGDDGKAYNLKGDLVKSFSCGCEDNGIACIYHYRWTYLNDISQYLKRCKVWYDYYKGENWKWSRVYGLNDSNVSKYKKKWFEIFKDNNKEDLSMVNRINEMGV